jgi:hypothetical protein
MEAFITCKMTPSEFDLMREAIHFYESNERHVATDSSTDVKLRQESRQRAFALNELSKKLK